MGLPALQNYYAGLLIVQYRNKSKAIQSVKLWVNSSLCDDLSEQVMTCFDLETAQGAQLDVLGRIVGVPRQVYGLDLAHDFFSFTRYDGIPSSVGFGRYSDTPYSQALFMRYRTDAIYSMTDFEMRALIKLKIIFNNNYSGLKNIKDALYTTFNGGIDIIDNADFTIVYNVNDPYHNAMKVAEFIHIVPKPMGVGLTVNYN